MFDSTRTRDQRHRCVYGVRERARRSVLHRGSISNLEIRRNCPRFCDADTTCGYDAVADDRNVFRIRTSERIVQRRYATDKMAKKLERGNIFPDKDRSRPFQLT